MGGLTVVRTRYVVAALLGIGLAAVAGGQEPRAFTLKFKNEKGEFVPFYQEMTTEVTQQIKVQGQDLAQQQKSQFFYQWTPIKEEPVEEGMEKFSRVTLKQRIEGLKMNIDISGNPINYDSTQPAQPGSAGNPGLVDFFKNLKDLELTVVLGKNYKVEKVDGKNEFIAKLGAGSGQMDQLLKKVMTEDALKEMADPTYKLLPDGPKKKDDKWERKTTLNLGPIGSYELTYKFTHMGTETQGEYKDMDKIQVEAVIQYTAPKDTTDPLLFRIKEGSTLKTEPKSEGVVYYDPKNQRIAFARLELKLKGDLTVVIGGADTKVELTQQQLTTIRTSDKSFLAPAETKQP
jgi:hypothetical protein